MKKYVYPCEISGTVKAPASKSEMQRAVAAALLARGESMLVNPSYCNDSLSAMGIAEALGASIIRYSDAVIIRGGLSSEGGTLNCGEAGLGIRMFTPIASLTGIEVTLTGEGTLKNRPVSMIEDSLRDLGMEIESDNGSVPVKVSSPIKGGTAEVDGGLSSQFLTGLLMALPCAEKDTVLKVKNLKSRQYIDITIDVLKKFNIEIENRDYREFRIKGSQKFTPAMIDIEGDWSGAAFLLCAGAIAGSITVTGINRNSAQPDRAIIDALEAAGAAILYKDDSVKVEHKKLKGFEFNASECPDLFPPLAVLGLYCEGRTVIRGVHRLKHKESDRAETIAAELGKLGGIIKIDYEGDVMIIEKSSLTGGITDSHGDHRIAMACAVAALGASGHVQIDGAECVNKSYKEFYKDLEIAGGKVK